MAKSTPTDDAPHPPHPHYPYQDGSQIQLDYYPEEHSKPQDGHQRAGRTTRNVIQVTVRVVRTLSTTFSCVLLVELVSSGRDGPYSARLLKSSRVPRTAKMILKLCDRRFSRGLRDDYNAAEWTQDIEAALIAFQGLPQDQRPEVKVSDSFEGDSWYDGENVNSDTKPTKGRSSGSSSGDSDDSQHSGDRASIMTRNVSNEHWPPGHREAYLQKWCDKMYAQELEVYRTLADVQGDKVPILYGSVCVRDKSRRSKRIAQVQGLLMEYKTPSFPLRDIPQRIPNQELWHDIGKDAVKLVQEIGDLGVINRDIRLDNILVVPIHERCMGSPNSSWELIPSLRELELGDEPRSFKVCMIDFGIARLQGEDETDEEFRKARRSQDEEGAVGYVLEKYLMRHAPKGTKPFNFTHSGRLDRPWDDDEADI